VHHGTGAHRQDRHDTFALRHRGSVARQRDADAYTAAGIAVNY